jgi:hypothetical protein
MELVLKPKKENVSQIRGFLVVLLHTIGDFASIFSLK